jgi:hypothetical protein
MVFSLLGMGEELAYPGSLVAGHSKIVVNNYSCIDHILGHRLIDNRLLAPTDIVFISRYHYSRCF